MPPQTPIRAHWRTVDVGGARVELFEATRGRPEPSEARDSPVVFLPGWGLTARAYQSALLPLCAAGLSVWAPSLPGFGMSSPLGLRAPLVAYAQRIIALLDTLNPKRPVFLTGHSFGGGVALKVAHLRPDLIRSVTVVNPVGGASDQRGLRRAGWLGWSLTSAVTTLPRRPRITMNPGQALRLFTDFLPNAARRPLRCAASGAIALTAQLAEDARQLVGSGMPVLYVWGDRDRLVQPGRLQGIAGPNGTTTVAGGHGWIVTHPNDFAALLHEALGVQALAERETRGLAVPAEAGALIADPVASLAALFPAERRTRARHSPKPPSALTSTRARPMA